MRKLYKDDYNINKKAIKELDKDAILEIKNFQKQGKLFVTTGELAKKLSVNSIQALGSLERIKPKLHNLGII